MTAAHDADDALLDSAQVADRLKVKIGTVYKLKATDPAFPKAASFNGPSPQYWLSDVDQYVEGRSRRSPSARGRRPRLLAPDAIDASVFAERLRAQIKAGAGLPDVRTQADLIRVLGLNSITFGQRMRGRTRWADRELTVIADRLHVDVTDANAVVEAARAQKA